MFPGPTKRMQDASTENGRRTETQVTVAFCYAVSVVARRPLSITRA